MVLMSTVDFPDVANMTLRLVLANMSMVVVNDDWRDEVD